MVDKRDGNDDYEKKIPCLSGPRASDTEMETELRDMREDLDDLPPKQGPSAAQYWPPPKNLSCQMCKQVRHSGFHYHLPTLP